MSQEHGNERRGQPDRSPPAWPPRPHPQRQRQPPPERQPARPASSRAPPPCPVDHIYRNYLDYPPGQIHIAKRAPMNFPSKLHQILSNADYSRIISWMPHGRAWKIHNKDLLVRDVLPGYFDQSKYESFNRQLNGWGFKRLHQSGNDHGAYYHECFMRGMPHLTAMMKRMPPNKGKKIPHTGGEPNFYEIGRQFPLPNAPAALPYQEHYPRYHYPNYPPPPHPQATGTAGYGGPPDPAAGAGYSTGNFDPDCYAPHPGQYLPPPQYGRHGDPNAAAAHAWQPGLPAYASAHPYHPTQYNAQYGHPPHGQYSPYPHPLVHPPGPPYGVPTHHEDPPPDSAGPMKSEEVPPVPPSAMYHQEESAGIYSHSPHEPYPAFPHPYNPPPGYPCYPQLNNFWPDGTDPLSNEEARSARSFGAQEEVVGEGSQHATEQNFDCPHPPGPADVALSHHSNPGSIGASHMRGEEKPLPPPRNSQEGRVIGESRTPHRQGFEPVKNEEAPLVSLPDIFEGGAGEEVVAVKCEEGEDPFTQSVAGHMKGDEVKWSPPPDGQKKVAAGECRQPHKQDFGPVTNNDAPLVQPPDILEREVGGGVATIKHEEGADPLVPIDSFAGPEKCQYDSSGKSMI